jgi:Molybdopterin-binding domain of aldehyde dehydrogenase
LETHYGQLIEHCTLKQVWDELKASCNFARVQQEAASFNRQNRWRKRGVAMVPTKFGISFTSSHLNQVPCAPTSLSVILTFYHFLFLPKKVHRLLQVGFNLRHCILCNALIRSSSGFVPLMLGLVMTMGGLQAECYA